MHNRIDHPAITVPGALKALQGLANAVKQADIPETTLYLVELRASQINGCGVCVDIHSRELKHAGESDPRISTVAVWRDVSYFTEAERAALALTEAATRLADRPDPVPDDVWENAARHYNETQLAALASRSPGSTPGTASTSPPGRSAGSGSASGSRRARRPARQPDAVAQPPPVQSGTCSSSSRRPAVGRNRSGAPTSFSRRSARVARCAGVRAPSMVS